MKAAQIDMALAGVFFSEPTKTYPNAKKPKTDSKTNPKADVVNDEEKFEPLEWSRINKKK